MAAHSEETTRIIEKAILKSTLGKLFSPLAIFARGDTFVVKHIKSTAKIGEIAGIVSQPEISVKNVLTELLNPRRISYIFGLAAEIALEKIVEEKISPIESLQLFSQFLKSFIVDYPYPSIEQNKMVEIELLTISGQKTGTSIKLPAEFAQIYENLRKFEQSIEKKKRAVEEKNQPEDTAYMDLYIELKAEFDRIDHLPTVSESYQRNALTRQIVFIQEKIDLLKEKMLRPPENEKEEKEEKETLTPRENEEINVVSSMGEAQLFQALVTFFMEKAEMTEEEAKEAAKESLEKRKQPAAEISAEPPVTESDDSLPASKLTAESAFALAIKNAMHLRKGQKKDDTGSDNQIEKEVAQFIENTRGITQLSVEEGIKGLRRGSTAAISIPRATKYTAIDSRDKDLAEKEILHVLPVRPSEEQLPSLADGYILTGHEKPVSARLYHLHQGQLVECHPGKLHALCGYVTESLKEKEAPLSLNRQQHRKFIIDTCGGHNYKKAEMAMPTLVAESSSSNTQEPISGAESSLSGAQGSVPTIAPENGPARRASSLSFSQSAPSKKYNLDEYEITLLKGDKDWPADIDIMANRLYYKWNSEKKVLEVKFKQGEAAPIHFPMTITNFTNISLLAEAFESPEDAVSEKVQKFLKFRTENPDIGQRSSMAFRKPPQAAAEQSGRRSVSPDKVEASSGDSSKEKDTAEKRERLTPSPTAVFMPPPAQEGKNGNTSPENTPASNVSLRKSQE